MFKVNNKNTETRSMTCSGVFVVNLNNFTPFSSFSIVDFKQVNISWAVPMNRLDCHGYCIPWQVKTFLATVICLFAILIFVVQISQEPVLF